MVAYKRRNGSIAASEASGIRTGSGSDRVVFSLVMIGVLFDVSRIYDTPTRSLLLPVLIAARFARQLLLW
jgi:hypothetical protein